MEQRDKELASLESLFPKIPLEEIRNFFDAAPAEYQVAQTLEFLFNTEQLRDKHQLIAENHRYAQLIHDLFPMYSVHKILKKLKKYQFCADRWKLIIMNVLKHAKKEDVAGVKRKFSDDSLEEDCTEPKRIELNNEDSDETVEENAFSDVQLALEISNESLGKVIANNTSFNNGFIPCVPMRSEDEEMKSGTNDQLEKKYSPDESKIVSSENSSENDDDEGSQDVNIPMEVWRRVNEISGLPTIPDSTEDVRSEIDRLLASILDLEAKKEKIDVSMPTDESQQSTSSQEKNNRVNTDQIPGPSSYYPERMNEMPSISNGPNQQTNPIHGLSEFQFRKFEELLQPSTTSKFEKLDNITKVQESKQSNIDAIPGPSTYDPYKGKNASRLRSRQHFDLIEYLVYSTGVPATSVANFCQKNGIDVFRERNQAELEAMIRDVISAEMADFDADDSVICVDDAPGQPLRGKKKRLENDRKSLISNGSVTDRNRKVNASTTAISSKVLSRVLEVFPDVDPDFVRNMYEKMQIPASSEAAIIDTLIENLLAAEYPKRPIKVPSPVKQVDPEEQLAFIKELLPDADPTFLQMKVAELTPDELKNFVSEALESRNYPTLKDYLRNQQLSSQTRQYTTEFSVENYVKLVPDPVKIFTDPKRTITLNREDVYYVDTFFRNKFNRLPVRMITPQLSHNQQRVYKTYKDLSMCSTVTKNLLKSKRGPVNLNSMVCKNIPLLQELAFIDHEEEILQYIEQLKLRKEQERKNARELGLMQVCKCCFEDEVMPDEAFCCENGCVCCKQCIVKSSEVAFGEGKLEFPCLGDCKLNYDLSTLQRFLPPNLFSKIAQKKAVQEVKAAGMKDLEFCPFCDFATIPSGPPETDKIFTCQNPECLKESCRLCKESSHVPLRCEEVEKDEDVKKRVFIENKMTEALLRKCWKCGISFYKEEGCNKMTCSCGATMCYVCGKAVDDYKHFNGIGGDKFNLCPLYSDTLKMNQQNVLQGAQKAKEEIGVTNKAELKIDPASDIEKFYQDRARRVPREPYLEQLDARHAVNMPMGEHMRVLYLVDGVLQRNQNIRGIQQDIHRFNEQFRRHRPH